MDGRLVLAQTNPRLGDLHGNLDHHLEQVAACRERADLLAFPELSLTGYFLKDQVFDLGLELDAPEIARIVEASKDVSIAFGFVERTSDGRFYNAYALAEGGALLGVHRKVHLVSYGIFDEERDFAAGERFDLFESRLGRIGPLICEDLWHAPSAYLHFLNDADAMLVASAPPLRGVDTSGPGLGSTRTWNTLLQACALSFRSYVAYVARVGWEDGIGFGGGTCLVSPTGEVRAGLEGFEPGLLEVELSRSELHRARIETPLRRDEKPWILAAELARHVPLLANLRAEPALRDE